MKRIVIAALALLCVAGNAWGYRPPTGGAAPVNPGNSPTSVTLNDYLGARPVDVRNYIGATGASCAVNIAGAVDAAYAAGVRAVFLPANCTYIPTGNQTPDGLGIVGGSLQTSIVASSSETGAAALLGPHGWVQNIAVRDQFCYSGANPAATSKLCPVVYKINIGDDAGELATWAYAFAMRAGAQSTGPTGVVSTDIPLIQLAEGSAGGDGIYIAATGATSSALRVVPNGSAANGLYVLPGWNQSTGPVGGNLVSYAVFDKDFTNFSNGAGSVYVDRVGDGTNVSPSIVIADPDALGNSYTRAAVAVTLNHQTSGSVVNLFQGTTAFSGNGVFMNFGVSGSFSGNFVLLQVAGTSVYEVDASGVAHATGLLLGKLANSASALPTNSVSAVENLKWSSAGDQSVRATFHLAASGSGTTAIRPTTDGTGTATTGNCGNLVIDNVKAVLHGIVLNATDETTPANDYAWFLPAAQLTRYTGVVSTVFHTMGTPTTSSNGTVTGASVSATADTTNACMNLAFTPPTGNTDTWRVVASFLIDRTQ